MKRSLKAVSATVVATLVLLLTGIAWYGVSSPPAQPVPLPAHLVDATSMEGERLLAGASAKTDHGQLLPYFVVQSRRAFCGVATASMVVNAALHPQPPLRQSSFFGTDISGLQTNVAVTLRGMTLEQLAQLLALRGLQVQTVHATKSSVEDFRRVAAATLSEPQQLLVVNYDRRRLGQEGVGHISPVGAYHAESDRLLIMDVAAYKYPQTWVKLPDLWSAMNTIDTDSGQTRGFLLIRAD
ncbi:phytochelatin synthase family protein [Piscinibacter sp. XHJ-5]|uniref:phytochelatin synthase family protein n=1 Tax=Piscinibacter sp. XHJ-5 TaxID=3037797 RepID=UPI002452AC15|nr:phytochelatin synthase family protein [Piscinibacter sp. XHJ-5]